MHTNMRILGLEQGADGEGHIPGWDANGFFWCIEKGREGIQAALGAVPGKLSILEPPSWPCPLCCWQRNLASIHCKESAIGCGKSRLPTVTGTTLCSASQAPAPLGLWDRAARKSRTGARHITPWDQVFPSVHVCWRQCWEEWGEGPPVYQKSHKTWNGISHRPLQFCKQPSAATIISRMSMGMKFGTAPGSRWFQEERLGYGDH